VRPEGLSIEAATFRIAAQCLNQPPLRAPDQDQNVHSLGDAGAERRKNFKSWVCECSVEGGNFITSLLATN
jgi:hypothetical protein